MNTPAQILAYLASIRGAHCISGQFTEIKGLAQITPGGAIAEIEAQSGEWLGLLGGDYWYFSSTEPTADTTFNALATAYAAAGGLVTLTLSMPNPTTGGYSGDVSTLDAADLLTAGTPTNTKFMTALSSVADGLAQISGVPVGLRMFHECNGAPAWFWWGLLPPADFVTLWQFTHDYLTKTRGLTNLYFILGANAGLAQMPIGARYPGAPYVGVVGVDGYTSVPAGLAADFAAIATYGKPVALTEFGSGSPSNADPAFNAATLLAALKGPLAEAVFVQTWWAPWGLETMQGSAALLQNPWMVNRGDIGATMPTPSPSNTTIPPATSIADAAGNAWTLTATGSVAVNGTVDASTSNVVELAYVAGTVWAKNGAGLWWGKSSPTAAWSPAAGTSVSPLPAPGPTAAQVAAALATVKTELTAVTAALAAIEAAVAGL
jgi:Glycosyl hydrolase family 26